MIDIVETTNQLTKEIRTYKPACCSPFNNGVEVFNALSPMPPKPIDLGDGRKLHISRWCPDGDEKIFGGENWLKVTVEGFIEYGDRTVQESPQ